LDINWGIEPKLLLNPELTRWQPQEDGVIILDPEFDPSSEANQQRLWEICMMLNQTSDFSEVNCMFQGFKPWVIAETGVFPIP
tara:strand:- start:159 stop:407 length:249 start_codon:yes stop_codon:yes gene_type:complete